jgi:hypothetical protein
MMVLMGRPLASYWVWLALPSGSVVLMSWFSVS